MRVWIAKGSSVYHITQECPGLTETIPGDPPVPVVETSWFKAAEIRRSPCPLCHSQFDVTVKPLFGEKKK